MIVKSKFFESNQKKRKIAMNNALPWCVENDHSGLRPPRRGGGKQAFSPDSWYPYMCNYAESEYFWEKKLLTVRCCDSCRPRKDQTRQKTSTKWISKIVSKLVPRTDL